MRRLVFLGVGLLECVVGVVLVLLGANLPARSEVEDSFGRVERVTRRAGDQVRRLRQQVHDLRRPDLHELAGRLRDQTRTVAVLLREQKVDFQSLATLGEALGSVSHGLHDLAQTLDPAGVGRLGEGLGETADFLERKLLPAAASAAEHLEKSTALLRADAEQLSAFLKAVPPDFEALREVRDSLGRFSAGLAKLGTALKLQRLDAVRDGFRGMEVALKTGAEQVEKLSGFTYPVLTFDGLRPEIERRQFWPEGDKIGAGMRKAAAGVTAANQEVQGLAKALPDVREALEASRRVVEAARATLAEALRHRDKVEPLLKAMPEHAARLAEELPRLGADLARVLRDTQKFKEVAAALRQAQRGVGEVVERWPELRKTMVASSRLLRAVHEQLARAVQHRAEYERAMKQTALLGEAFAALLPLLTDQLTHQLHEEEQSLDDLGQSIDEVGAVLPAYGQTTSRLVLLGRLLAWLVAGIVALHGVYLLLSVRMGRRFSP
jgi:hypothetical protein